MKYYLSLLIICQSLFSYSQKHSTFTDQSKISLIQKTSIYSFNKSPQSLQNEDVKSFIEREFNVNLNSSFFKSSPVAHYYLFQQTFQNRPIYSAEIKVTLDRKGNVKRIDNSTVDIPIDLKLNFFNDLDVNLVKGNKSITNIEKEEIVIYDQGVFKPALKAVVTYSDFDYVEFVFDEDENQLVKHNLNVHFTVEKDTVANLVIFNPDPMTKANVFWTNGDDYDKNDLNEGFLNPLRDTASIELTYDSNTNKFKLENDRCVISEFSAPVNPVETSSTPFFEYSRAHYGFEEVNAYYHITNTQKHLVELGFNLVDYKIEVDANALNGNDNSMFSYASNPPRLFFGEGGVDDAEDADVVIHEYGHAISHSASGATNNGTERRCLDEAIGDYFGCSYSYLVNPFKWENAFSWDGHNQYWQGRRGDNPMNKMYPQTFSASNIYEHTDLYVCALMEIYMTIGRFESDQLVTESLYGYFSNMTFTDAALLVVQADSAYNAGVNVPIIWSIFYNKGILPSNPVSIYENSELNLLVLGTLSFSNGKELTIINQNNENLEIEIYDLNGKLVFSQKVDLDIKISGAEFESGVFILMIKDEKGNLQTEKLIRY